MISMAPMPSHATVGRLSGNAVAALLIVFVAWALVYFVLKRTVDGAARREAPSQPRERLNRVKYVLPQAVADGVPAPNRTQTDDSSS